MQLMLLLSYMSCCHLHLLCYLLPLQASDDAFAAITATVDASVTAVSTMHCCCVTATLCSCFEIQMLHILGLLLVPL